MIPMIVAISIATVFVAILGWRYWEKKKRYQCLESLPCPPKHWLLGNIPQILQAVKKKQLFQQLFKWSQTYGSIYVYWADVPVIVLSDPLLIENTIINGMRDGSFVRSPKLTRAWNDISSPILLGQSGAEWQWRRKAWNPEFSPVGIASYLGVVEQACSQITNKIQSTANTEVVQADKLFVELTMRVIASLLLGIPVDNQVLHQEGIPLDVPKVYEAMSVLGYRFLRVATSEKPWMKYLPTQSSRDYWNARKYLDELLETRVDIALKLRESQSHNSSEISSLFRESMLVKIAAKEPRYEKESLIAEAIELMIAGTDTTAHTLSFALGELASHPEIYQKAQAIVDRVCQQYSEISLESLKELNYIQAVIKETLRLYSVASGSTSLQAVKSTTINDIHVPVGTKVFWSMQGAGRDANTYAQPDQFLPERWLEEGKGNFSLPMIDFSSGAHRCLGEHLAMLEATIMLTKLLQNFNWELVNGRDSLENLQQNLLIYPADGLPVRFYSRS